MDMINTPSPTSTSSQAMYRSGLLVVPSSLQQVPRSLTPLFSAASEWIRETLYVFLYPPGNTPNMSLKYTTDVEHSIAKAYERGATLCAELDLRVLMSNVGVQAFKQVPHLRHRPDIMIIDKSTQSRTGITQYVQDYFCLGKEISVLGVATGDDGSSPPSAAHEERRTFRSVCLGGTFDRLHNGHKVLLSQACLASEAKLTVGLTREEMHRKKVLMELMQPTAERMAILNEFLSDVRPDIETEIVPITDPYGPTIHRPEMDCLVVSQETLAGGRKVNEVRHDKGFAPMELIAIDVVDDANHTPGEEEAKLSSTTCRRRALGKLIRKREADAHSPPFPYVIGLTGGIATGKSTLCGLMGKFGAEVIDCDALGHQAYRKGTPAHGDIVKCFGSEVLDEETGQINRRALGRIVFSDREKLQHLNAIVWPAIKQAAMEKIEDCRMRGVHVVVLDAAVLLEAGWDEFVHEVWVVTLPVTEAMSRLQRRNGLSEEEARGRVEAQITDEQRVGRANVVLSTLWDEAATRKQLEKAWCLLRERLQEFQMSLDMSQ